MPAPSFVPPRPSSWPTADEPQLVLEAGKVIANKYVLERHAGFGGMSQLWVATNKATCAEVCVKILVPEGKSDTDGESIERFRREAHAAARLTHRAIVRVFDLLELDEKGEVTSSAGPTSSPRSATKGKQDDGGAEASASGRPHAYAIVMELLRGETLGDLLAKRGKLPLEEALDLFLPVVSALAHAHRASVIHRDIKPDNIFLAADPDGQIIPKVLDFGVSKLSNADAITIDGVVVGTPSFMSPEQAKGGRVVDARSDVFSAGILFYMMLAGKNPFEEGTFATVIEAILRREVPALPELASSPEIWSVLHRALEKDPAARWNDATEMGIALRKAAGRKSTTDSNPIMPLEPLSQRTLDRLGIQSQQSSDRVSIGGPSSGSSLGSGSASKTPSGRHDSNVSVPPAGPDSIPLTGVRWLGVGKRRRNLVIGILGCASMILIVAALVKVVSPDRHQPARSVATGRPPTAISIPTTTAATTMAAPPPTPTVTVSGSDAVTPPSPSSKGTSTHTTTTATATTTTATTKRIPSATPTIRRPGDQNNIARDPGF